MNTLEEVLARLSEIRTDLENIAAIEGDLDEAQRSDWDALNTEWDTLDAKRVELEGRAERLRALRSTNLMPATGDGAEGADVERSRVTDEFNAQRSTTDDIYELGELATISRSSGAYGTAVRDRAMRSIEDWEGVTPEMQASAERLIANAGRAARRGKHDHAQEIAEHILRTAQPDYVEGFYNLLESPQLGVAGLDIDQAKAFRAAMNEGTTTQGGFMVPPMLDPSIILTNAGISNPFRQRSTIKSITTQTWKGVTSAGVTAEWTAEAAEAADASPTVAQPSITPVRADAYVQASFEMVEDTSISGELAMLFADARDRLEGTAFAVGTGSTQPHGIVTELGLVTASRVSANTNGTYGAVDVYAVDNALPQRWRANATWVANKSIYNLTRQFASGSGPQHAFWTDLGGGRPPILIGYDADESSAMFNAPLSTATASNDDILVLGDFRQYYIVDRVGMQVAYNPLVIGSNRRPTGEVGWFAFWRVGGRTVNADAFRMLRV